LAQKLAANPKTNKLAGLRQVLDEIAIHHPHGAKYLRTMANRPEDFASFKPAPARE
jgi:hypothetical protein